jgi:hypothetical protein
MTSVQDIHSSRHTVNAVRVRAYRTDSRGNELRTVLAG